MEVTGTNNSIQPPAGAREKLVGVTTTCAPAAPDTGRSTAEVPGAHGA